jgi:hypothetical protein
MPLSRPRRIPSARLQDPLDTAFVSTLRQFSCTVQCQAGALSQNLCKCSRRPLVEEQRPHAPWRLCPVLAPQQVPLENTEEPEWNEPDSLCRIVRIWVSEKPNSQQYSQIKNLMEALTSSADAGLTSRSLHSLRSQSEQCPLLIVQRQYRGIRGHASMRLRVDSASDSTIRSSWDRACGITMTKLSSARQSIHEAMHRKAHPQHDARKC